MKAAQGNLLKYVLSVLILLTLTGGLSAQNSYQLNTREFRFTKNYQLGLTAFNKEDFQTAEFYLNACLEQQPRNREALMLRAMCRQRTGQTNGAISDYSLLIKTEPNHAEALYSRGLLFYKKKQYEPASKDFARMLDLPQTETQAVFYKTGVNEQGISEVATLQTMQADIYNYIGLCAHHMNKYQDALEYFDEAITRFEDNADFYINRGLTFEVTGQTIRAIEDFKKALKTQPGNEIAKYNLTRMQSGQPEGEDAIASYTDIIESNPNFSEAYFNRGLAYYNSKQYQSAMADYNRALAIDSSRADAWFNRALAKQKLKDLHGALSDLDHATDLQPNFEKAWHGKGVVLTKMEQYQNAISMYDLAIHYDPDYALAWYNRGIAKLNLKQNTDACHDFNRALKLGLITAKKIIDIKCY